MKTSEQLWGNWIQPETVQTETSASVELLQPKQKKTLCTEKEFDKVFSEFFGNVKKN
jgi:hypothetical protein